MSDMHTPPLARSIEGTCDAYGWTRAFVYERLASGELEGRKAGRRTLVVTASSDRLFASLPRAKFRPLPQRAA